MTTDPETADDYGVAELERRADEAVIMFVVIWCVVGPAIAITAAAIARFGSGVE